jgi:hypothetical protein
MTTAFEVELGDLYPLSERHFEVYSGKLYGFAAGKYPGDVELLSELGEDPSCVEGCRPLAEVIEDTLTGRWDAPVPLDRDGKAARALRCVLRLSYLDTSERPLLDALI